MGRRPVLILCDSASQEACRLQLERRRHRASEPGGYEAVSRADASNRGNVRNPAGRGTQDHSMACAPRSVADHTLPDQGRWQNAARAMAQKCVSREVVDFAETVHLKDPANGIG